MSELLVFDPALCCSMGVCGHEAQPELADRGTHGECDPPVGQGIRSEADERTRPPPVRTGACAVRFAVRGRRD